jgi:hypothetical protein
MDSETQGQANASAIAWANSTARSWEYGCLVCFAKRGSQVAPGKCVSALRLALWYQRSGDGHFGFPIWFYWRGSSGFFAGADSHTYFHSEFPAYADSHPGANRHTHTSYAYTPSDSHYSY